MLESYFSINKILGWILFSIAAVLIIVNIVLAIYMNKKEWRDNRKKWEEKKMTEAKENEEEHQEQ